MGCNIHVYLEELCTVNGILKWRSRIMTMKSDYTESIYMYDNESEEAFKNRLYAYEAVPVICNRDYWLFSILANVCNYDNSIQPISEPRGLPSDCCDEIHALAKYWGTDGHSHSYFTLLELKKELGTRNNIVTSNGFVRNTEVEKVRAGGQPTTWCRGICDKSKHTWLEWTAKCRLLEIFYEALCNYIKVFGDWYNLEDEAVLARFRVVFWFDN